MLGDKKKSNHILSVILNLLCHSVASCGGWIQDPVRRTSAFFSNLRKREKTGKAKTRELESLSGFIEKDKQEIAKIARAKESALKETEKKINELGKQMLAVQKSTKTSLSQLGKLHNYFRMRFTLSPVEGFGWYYRRHLALEISKT